MAAGWIFSVLLLFLLPLQLHFANELPNQKWGVSWWEKAAESGKAAGKIHIRQQPWKSTFLGKLRGRSPEWRLEQPACLKVGPNEFPARVSRLPVAIKMAAPQMRNSCGCACAQFNWPGASNYAIVAVEIDRKQASNNFEFISERHNLCRNSI